MEKYITNIKNSNHLSDTTKSLYLKHFDIIENKISKKKLFDILNNPKQFKKDLLKYCSNNKGRTGKTLGNHFKESYLTSIMALFIHNNELKENIKLYDEWKTIQNQIKKPIITKYNSNKPTVRQKKALVNYDELINIKNNLEKGSIEKLLFSFYLDIPPLRADFYEIILYKDTDTVDKSKNYIKNNTLFLHNFKTSKLYKEIKIPLPKSIIDELNASLLILPRKYLFINKQKKPFKKNSFTKWANLIFKKYINSSFSINMFRHIYISRKDLKLNTKSGLEQNKIASKMGHSIETQHKYMWL